MISALISRLVILVFGLLYPAYGSYKAVKNKDIKLYVKWMMYWIVFALFTASETFTDIILSFWFPFYYELKVIIVIWLLSPVTRGSSVMYRRVIHPLFLRREQEIDELISKAKDQGYNVILDIGCKGMNLATSVIMSTAVKGSTGLLFHLKKSYSLNDLNGDDIDNIRFEMHCKKSKDCKSNLHDCGPYYDSKAMSEHDNSSSIDNDTRRFCYERSTVSRKGSLENFSKKKDNHNESTKERPRRTSRQVLIPKRTIDVTLPRKKRTKKQTI